MGTDAAHTKKQNPCELASSAPHRDTCINGNIRWVVMDSNHRRQSQQIYSLPHLATLVTTLSMITFRLLRKASAKVASFVDNHA